MLSILGRLGNVQGIAVVILIASSRLTAMSIHRVPTHLKIKKT